ncbi:hypothetical protein lerEdw1_009603 [Lerista edwardsae]|nr:hypothetical protein lerEdw1_009603 [Lerista edwardsae]
MHCLWMCWLHVGIVLFLADKVVSLECETCHNLENQTCNGTLETCKPHYDKCAIALSKSLLVPPINHTSNGKKCPACYYWGNGKCPERIVECFGEEFFCLELFGTGDTGRHIVPLTIKGCINKAICDGFAKGPLSMGGVTISGEGKCTPASRTDGPVPSWFGLILRVLMVLVLMKVLP